MHYSHLLKRDIPEATHSSFMKVASKILLRQAASTLIRSGRLRRSERKTTVVKEAYDEVRSKLTFDDYDTYVFGDNGDDFYLDNNIIVYGSPRNITHARMDKLLELVQKYSSGGKIIEFGSGNGRNLFHLRKNGVTAPLLGLELSPVSVEKSRMASEHFGLPVDFETKNLCEPLDPSEYGDVDIIFSVHAFEMMPRIYTEALDNIRVLNPKAVIFFEPIEELWPRDWRGMLSRLRVRQLDRLRDLYKNGRKLGKVVEARGMGQSTNPLNETSLMIVELRQEAAE